MVSEILSNDNIFKGQLKLGKSGLNFEAFYFRAGYIEFNMICWEASLEFW